MTLMLEAPTRTSLNLRVTHEDGLLVHARVDGPLSHRFHAPYDEPLAVAVGFGAYERQVLLNLSGVSSVDTHGVNWLLTLQQRMSSVGGRLILHSLSPAARGVIRVLQLHTVLNVVVDESTAKRLAEANAAVL